MLILMSDGCHRHVPEDKTAAVCRTSATSVRAAQTLVCLALDAGGSDNITVVVAQKAPPPKGWQKRGNIACCADCHSTDGDK